MNCDLCDDCPFEFKRAIPEMHEIHITVSDVSPKAFEKVCLDNNIKPLLIGFQNKDKEALSHLMTGQRVKGTKRDAEKEQRRILDVFRANGFSSDRIKIESSLTYPDCLYHECHLAFEIKNDEVEKLAETAKSIHRNLRVSKNAFKECVGVSTYMVTLRMHTTRRDWVEEELHETILRFEEKGYIPKKTILECCWKDDNLALDDEWC